MPKAPFCIKCGVALSPRGAARAQPLSEGEKAELKRLCAMQSEVLCRLIKLGLDPDGFVLRSLQGLRDVAAEKVAAEKREHVH